VAIARLGLPVESPSRLTHRRADRARRDAEEYGEEVGSRRQDQRDAIVSRQIERRQA
jgi:hypothetical protein